MADMVHNAIVVTSRSDEHIKKARTKAVEIGLPVSEIIVGLVNGYFSFLVGPDGSKEGWADSIKGDTARQRFIAEIAGLYLEWVEVRYGNDPFDGPGRGEVVNHEIILGGF
jgi:hypothetical protein